MTDPVHAIRQAMRHELLKAKEWIENELHRLDEQERPTPIRVDNAPKPPNYGNSGLGIVPRHSESRDEAQIGSI